MPLYDSLGENAIEYIIKHAGCSAVFVSSNNASTLIHALPDLTGIVKTVVIWGTAGEAKAKVCVHCACSMRLHDHRINTRL